MEELQYAVTAIAHVFTGLIEFFVNRLSFPTLVFSAYVVYSLVANYWIFSANGRKTADFRQVPQIALEPV